MTQLDDVCRQIGAAEYVMMVIVEDAVGVGRPATPGLIAGLIAGAPIPRVRERLERLVYIGALDKVPNSYRVTSLGASMLSREVDDWEPAPREQARRDAEELRASRLRA